MQATTNEDVRKAAGISGSQLSHYFADKQHLVAAVIGEKLLAWSDGRAFTPDERWENPAAYAADLRRAASSSPARG